MKALKRIARKFLTSVVLFSTSCLFANQPDHIELVGKSVVDREALTFAVGPATRFSSCVNGRSHQQTALTSYLGHQYATYVDSQRRICVGRRRLPDGGWEIIRFDDHKLVSNDSHNTAVLGICRKDGTLHLAFDHHATPLNYRVSKPGIANEPRSVRWEPGLFSPISHSLGDVASSSRVTYPRFISAPNGNLMLYYRAVTSGNGDGVIEEYDGAKHQWTPGLGRFIARDIGVYAARGQTSDRRCPYMNTLCYAGGKLHAAWVWRELFQRTHPSNQHDLCYAFSDDDGRTWRNSTNQIIGKTGEQPIHLESPGLVVAEIPTQSGLTNSNTQFVGADGVVHVVMRQRSDAATDSCYHHHWRTQDGTWDSELLPFTGDRPKLVGAQDGTLVLVCSDEEQLFIVIGRPNAGHTSWQWTRAALPEPVSIYGEALIDLERWEDEELLSLYIQLEPSEQIVTDRPEPIDGVPTALLVVDYRLTANKMKDQSE